MGGETSDSQRAWALLIDRIAAIERAHDRSDADDTEAWREYRRKCEAYDKCLAAVKADVAAVKTRLDTPRASESKAKFVFTVDRVILAVVALLGAVGTMMSTCNRRDFTRWQRPGIHRTVDRPARPPALDSLDSLP